MSSCRSCAGFSILNCCWLGHSCHGHRQHCAVAAHTCSSCLQVQEGAEECRRLLTNLGAQKVLCGPLTCRARRQLHAGCSQCLMLERGHRSVPRLCALWWWTSGGGTPELQGRALECQCQYDRVHLRQTSYQSLRCCKALTACVRPAGSGCHNRSCKPSGAVLATGSHGATRPSQSGRRQKDRQDWTTHMPTE